MPAAGSWWTCSAHAWLPADHGLVVGGLRQSRAGHGFRNAHDEPLPARHGRRGGFPAATKAVAEWFPVGERSTAMGIINAGTSAGAVVAPPLIAITLATLNWRWSSSSRRRRARLGSLVAVGLLSAG